MTARRFDPAANRAEIDKLYGPEPIIDWPTVISTALQRSPDLRDQRDPAKIGKRVLARARRKKVQHGK